MENGQRVGFIGLGNVGAKLAGSIVRNGFDLVVHDLDRSRAASLEANGARWADSPVELVHRVDVIITCLPSPEVSAGVLEGENGILSAFRPGMVWMEMSTTDEAEVRRLADKITAAGGIAMECPVSGGCHRAATGNIAILAGGPRQGFDRVFPLLAAMGRQILHTGPLGSASILKVITNYLATANLLSLCEALVTAERAGMDLTTTYHAIRISSGNSFVHETESQVILNGSRDINFTMDLVAKDLGLFQAVADRAQVDLELVPVFSAIFADAIQRYGSREWSPNVIRRLEERTGADVRAPGFPSQMVDDEPEVPGVEIRLDGHRE
jgi:3-hydroxyisobutyrate dehydrogenase